MQMAELTTPPPEEHCFSTPFDHSPYSTPTPTASTTTTSSSSQHDEKIYAGHFTLVSLSYEKDAAFIGVAPFCCSIYYTMPGSNADRKCYHSRFEADFVQISVERGYWVLCFEHVCLLPFHG